jgi:tetratricopeptide (TPR) repeat protein
VNFGLWTYSTSRSQFDRSRQLSTRMADLVAESGDDGLWLQALHTRWTEALFMGDLAGAVAVVEEGRRTYRYEDHHPLSFRYGNHDPGVCALTLGAMARALRGEPDHAAQMTAQARALAEALHHPVSLAQARFMATWVQQIFGDSAAALESVQAALADFADLEVPIWQGVGRWVVAWALSHEGRDAEALEAAEEAGEGLLSVTSGDVFSPMAGCVAADVYLRAGRVDRAAAISVDMEKLLTNVDDHFYAAEVLRTRARVLAATGERAGAISLARQALDRAESQGARALSIMAATTLVSLADNRAEMLGDLRSVVGPLAGRDDVPYVRLATERLRST